MTFKRTLGAAVAVAALLVAVGGAGTAHAVPAYGYSYLEFDHFTLNIGSATFGANPTVLANDSASYLNLTPDARNASGDITNGGDVLEAFSGPSIWRKPIENTFTAALTATSGTRGDGRITGALSNNATSQAVAEGRLTSGPGSAASSS